jgi:serralysin
VLLRVRNALLYLFALFILATAYRPFTHMLEVPAMAYLDSSGNAVKVSAASKNWFFSSATLSDVVGSTYDDYLEDTVSGATLSGGAGDDVYVSWSRNTKIVEGVSSGTDTFKSTVTFNPVQNVENYVVAGVQMTAHGNAQDNFIEIQGAQSTIIGGRGNDTIVDLGKGGNIFAFGVGSGNDTIYNFDPKANDRNANLIQISGYDLNSFSGVAAAMTQVGPDVSIALSATDTITIRAAKLADFSANDFLLDLDRASLKLAFSDEFNDISLYNAATSTGTWKTNFLTGSQDGWGSYDSRTLTPNGEKQIYVDASYAGDPRKSVTALGLNPFSVDDGVLTITVSSRPRRRSSRLTAISKFALSFPKARACGRHSGFSRLQASGRPRSTCSSRWATMKFTTIFTRGTAARR